MKNLKKHTLLDLYGSVIRIVACIWYIGYVGIKKEVTTNEDTFILIIWW